MKNKNPRHIHFMGIGGSGVSAVALLAKEHGFEISGCDLDLGSSYLDKVKKSNIKIYPGHSQNHIEGADLIVISPAVEYQNKDHPEYQKAKKLGKLMTWQKFLGEFVLKGKKVVAVSGTHGKGTVTAMISLIFEKAGMDPSALVGAKVKAWDSNFRLGKSNLFILESDEFNDNFLNYQPSFVVVNNIEFDHPDYFFSEDKVIESFAKFVKKLKRGGRLVVNQDSSSIRKLFKRLGDFTKNLDVYGYTFENRPLLEVRNSAKIKVLSDDSLGTSFTITIKSLDYHNSIRCDIPGRHNVANAAAAVVVAKLFDVDDEAISTALSNFKGLARRLDLIGEKKGVVVYDDYAHHPTEIAATLSALRQKYPKERIWAIVEPHSYSRTKALLPNYKGVFKDADKVIVGPIFKARDKEKFGVGSYSIVKVSDHDDIKFIPTEMQIAYKLKKEVKKKDVVVVMGAGKSFRWAREILKRL